MEETKESTRKLSKCQAHSIACLTSSIYMQDTSWVMRIYDLQTGVERLIRNLSHKSARKKLSSWRREKVEELLREEKDAKAYMLRFWEENPQWEGQGVWHWAQSFWYTTKEEAEKALDQYKEKLICEVYETETANIPGNFQVI